ncbi:DNA polymerase I [Rickettsiella massiliensis]|uniref:DNA polymerase I n=1 Tax=Rickettsiella massiliensis TaxID=676517 RepID=UPI00029A1EE5|nr:DNA polymerase I [Rickettsiella massiliensis]
MKKKPLILVDGSSYLYRAYHALPPLNNSQGQPTGAIYGVVNMLRKLLKSYTPEYLAIVFDSKEKTFRHSLCEDYKANRPTMPEELQQQIEPLYAIIDAMGLPRFLQPGVEADDIIATLAEKLVSADQPILISSGDKDFAQLVNAHIILVNTMSETYLDEQGVLAKFGVTPEQIIDYLALVGDTSDNVAGVPGVGPKTAAKWLQHYGSLSNLVAHAADIPGKIGEKLRAHLDQLSLAQRLVTIKRDVDLPIKLADLRAQSPNWPVLKSWFEKLEFKTWLKECDAHDTTVKTTVSETTTAQTTLYQTLLNKTEFTDWLTILKKASRWALDTETTDLDSMKAELVGLSFAIEANKAVYIPLAHDYPEAPKQLPKAWVLAQLKPLLENPTLQKIGHHLKYDMNVLANQGITLQGIAFDTLLESYLLDSASNQHSLDNAAWKHLAYKTTSFTDIAGKGVKQKTFNQIPLDIASKYAAEDSDITLQLHQQLWPQLQQLPQLAELFTEIEMPLISVLSRIERRGVLINTQLLHQQSVDLAQRIDQLEKQAYLFAGKTFNLNSPKQLQSLLFEEKNLPVLEKTPTGQPSTSENVLQLLAPSSPFVQVILDYRRLTKLKSTYVDKLPQQINPKTGRIHTSYHQAAVVTGRLSSSDPNLQNIPIRHEEGRKIRKAFIAAPGYRLIAADYSQIELRIMAHFSQDAGLLHAFQQNLDIHQATASEIFKTPLDAVTTEQRRCAKAVNFGLIYGMSAFGLARQLGIDRTEAKAYIDRYFKRYPGVKAYMERTRQEAKAQGYVTTLFGRRLHLPHILSQQTLQQKASERAAINAPLQGSAADIIKKAMIATDQCLRSQKLDATIIMQVHDELVIEAEASQVPQIRHQLEQCMIHAATLCVPLVVDIGCGLNWDEAH